MIRKFLSCCLSFAALVVLAVGCIWGLTRGGQDFNVFYSAWGFVLSGRSSAIYHATPDRFLYAPGFAWILSPLALLPLQAAFLAWTGAKLAALFGCARLLVKRMNLDPIAVKVGFLVVARPLLIDFQYGQVNVFILAACIWALVEWISPSADSRAPFIAWCILAIAAVAKLFPLPLLILPCFSRAPRGRAMRLGVLLGLALILLPPFLQGIREGIDHYLRWWGNLESKGLPMESHNQSFAAVLRHLVNGEPIHVQALGSEPFKMGEPLLSGGAIRFLTWIWSSVSMGFLVFQLVCGSRAKSAKASFLWVGLCCGLIILPSHLVWKPYFIFAAPAAIALSALNRRWAGVVLGMAFVLFNFTGFDFVGARMAAYFEAGGALLGAYLLIVASAWRALKKEAV